MVDAEPGKKRNNKHEEVLDEKKLEEIEIEAKQILLDAVMRELNIVARYFEFRMRELYTKGIIVNFGVEREVGLDYINMTLKVSLPEFLVRKAVERLGELRGFHIKMRREERKNDRYKYRFE